MMCVFRYTREAGVRSLERKIGAICRAVAVKVAEGDKVMRSEASLAEGASQGVQDGGRRTSMRPPQE